jgi:hypothetical protein
MVPGVILSEATKDVFRQAHNALRPIKTRIVLYTMQSAKSTMDEAHFSKKDMRDVRKVACPATVGRRFLDSPSVSPVSFCYDQRFRNSLDVCSTHDGRYYTHLSENVHNNVQWPQTILSMPSSVPSESNTFSTLKNMRVAQSDWMKFDNGSIRHDAADFFRQSNAASCHRNSNSRDSMMASMRDQIFPQASMRDALNPSILVL